MNRIAPNAHDPYRGTSSDNRFRSERTTRSSSRRRRAAALTCQRVGRTSGAKIIRNRNANNAAKPLEQILAIEPTNAEAIRELKDLYSKRRAWRPLFDVSRREAERLTGDARRDSLVELAKLAAEKLGANADAIGLWREALAIDPRTPGALDALEKLTEREKDYAGLADVLERRADAERLDRGVQIGLPARRGVPPGWVKDELQDPMFSTVLGVFQFGLRTAHEHAVPPRRKTGLLSNLTRIFAAT